LKQFCLRQLYKGASIQSWTTFTPLGHSFFSKIFLTF
jgi:hypothetical protein